VVATDLDKLAHDFAERMQRVLNTTICDCVHISAVTASKPGVVLVGHGLDRTSFTSTPFQVGLRKRRPRCWLDIFFKLCLDEPSSYLTVLTSFFGIYAADDEQSCLCHFDYERNKADDYPEAHLQIHGDSTALANWSSRQRKRPLNKLHFPVGGRRFRPSLEDVIEFLIVENLADPRDDWAVELKKEREEFARIQLRASIRSDPHTSLEAARDLGLI